MIPFLILTVLIILGVCITLSTEKNNVKTNACNISDTEEKICGVKIQLSEKEKLDIASQIKLNEQEQFEEQKEKLLSQIRAFKNDTSDLLTNKILDAILKININDMADFERVKFLFNNGEFRTNEEVEFFDKKVLTEEKRNNYDKERKNVTLCSFLVSFLFSFLIAAGALNDIVLLPVALLIAIIFGLIGLLIGHSINISNAKDYCIPDNDPRVLDEKHKLTADVIAGIIGIGSVIHNTKSAVKDITNVDGWKEMK